MIASLLSSLSLSSPTKESQEAKADAPSGMAADVAALQYPMKVEGHPDIEVRKVKDKGRGLFTTRAVEPGTTLLRLQPQLLVPHENAIKEACYICFQPYGKKGEKEPLIACQGCKLVKYCSSKCKKVDQLIHQRECKAIQQHHVKERRDLFDEEVVDPGVQVRSVARLFWSKEIHGDEWYASIDALESHEGHFEKDVDHLQIARKAAEFIKGADGGMPDETLLRQMHSKLVINSMPDSSAEVQDPFCTVLQSTAALINHSCVPNVNIVYPQDIHAKDGLHIVALKPMTAGEELVYSYCCLSDPYKQRQEILQSRWHFKCKCELCIKSEKSNKATSSSIVIKPWDPRMVVWCGRSTCNGWVSQCPITHRPLGKCSKCKQACLIRTDDVANVMQESQTLLDKLISKEIDISDFEEAKRLVAPTMKKLSTVMPPSAHPLFKLLLEVDKATVTSSRELMLLYDWIEEKLRFKFMLLAAMNAGGKYRLYPSGHPTYAKMLSQTSQDLMTYRYHDRMTYTIRSKTHNPSNFLNRGATLLSGLQRAMAGLQYMRQAIEQGQIAFGNDQVNVGFVKHLNWLLREYEANPSPVMGY